jgi:hypothetical protein
MSHEELLRDTLQAKAREAQDTLTLDDVRRDVARARHRTAWRTGAVAAAVLVVLAVPTALLLRPDDHGPEPVPSPTSTPSTPSVPPSPTPSTTSSSLTQVPRGRGIAVAWMSNGTIHARGRADVSLPPAVTGTWTSFTNYHGGWLLTGDAGVVQLDGNGGWEPVAQSGGGIAITSDGLRTAFLASDPATRRDVVRVGITTGMGQGEDTVPASAPDLSCPIGFLSSDRVACNGLKGQVLVLDATTRSTTVLSGLSRASAASAASGLVAGTTVADDGTAAVVSASTGKILWTKQHWVTGRFSPDGRHLAAYHSASGGEFETVAILDAHTGARVAATDPSLRALPDLDGFTTATSTAWDEDGSLLIPYRDGQTWTILRLTTDGHLTRATDVFDGTPYDADLVFAARP